jgi:hypothetical protein
MTRIKRTEPESGERYIIPPIKWPTELWRQVEERIPEQDRSEFVRQAVQEALLRRAAERLQHFYATDPETVAWGEFVGDDPDEAG